MDLKEDATLVAEALAGDMEAFGLIIERYKDAVFAVALARLRNFHDAEDLAQQAFLEAYESLSRLKDPARLGAFLRAITIHRCLNHLRGRGRFVDIATIPEPAAAETAPHLQEQRERVMAAVSRLSKPQRETVTLFYVSGYALQEIADIQGVPVGTVKYRLHEARNRLKKELMDMVGEVIKGGVPKQDFAARVFELLCAYPDFKGGRIWCRATREELVEIGPSGLEGFTRALNLPHWRTRHAAVHYLVWADRYQIPAETAIELLKKGLADTNRRVRAQAAWMLTYLNLPDARKYQEFVPLLLPLLSDRSRKVRFIVAGRLGRGDADYAAHVPLEVVMQAIEKEHDDAVQKRLGHLLQAVVMSRRQHT